MDWVGFGLDAGGIILDAITLGTVGKTADMAKLGRTAGSIGDLGDMTAFAISWAQAALATMAGDRSGKEVVFGPEATDLYVDAADLASPIPIVFDTIGLYRNVSQAVYWAP